MNSLTHITIFILIILTSIKSYNSNNLTELKKVFDNYINTLVLPSSSLMLLKYDQNTKQVEKIYENYGNAKNSISESYVIGSNSKSFTCLGISILINENKLSINDTIDKYLDIPYFFPDEKSQSQAKKTTIFQLVTHSSGLIRHASEKKLSFPNKIGEFSYSNCGIALLGKIIEKITNMSYRDFIKENIFNKLNMSNSEVGIDEAIKNENVNLIDSYMNLFGIYIKKNNEDLIEDKFMTPAGYLVISKEDMLKYLEIFILKNKIEEKIINTMIQNNIIINSNNYTYGFGLIAFNYTIIDNNGNNKTIKIFFHGGNTETFSSQFAFIPELNLAGAFFTNTDDQVLNPSMEFINNFPLILAGKKVELKYNFSLTVFILDLEVFGSIIIAIIIIIYKIVTIVKKSEESTKCKKCKIILFLILNIIYHFIIPTFLIIILVIILSQGLSFSSLFCMVGSYILWILILMPLQYIGGIIKFGYYIYSKQIDNKNKNDIDKIENIRISMIENSNE